MLRKGLDLCRISPVQAPKVRLREAWQQPPDVKGYFVWCFWGLQSFSFTISCGISKPVFIFCKCIFLAWCSTSSHLGRVHKKGSCCQSPPWMMNTCTCVIATGTHPSKHNRQLIQIVYKKKVRSRGTPPYINQPRERSLDVLRGPNEGGSHLANNPFD